jgi:hypothetical protein
LASGLHAETFISKYDITETEYGDLHRPFMPDWILLNSSIGGKTRDRTVVSIPDSL